MISSTDLNQLAGTTMHGADGQIGKSSMCTSRPTARDGTFVTVSTGLFSGHSFVPLTQATMQGKDVVVPYSKDLVKTDLDPASGDRADRNWLEHIRPSALHAGLRGSARASLNIAAQCHVRDRVSSPMPVGGRGRRRSSRIRP